MTDLLDQFRSEAIERGLKVREERLVGETWPDGFSTIGWRLWIGGASVSAPWLTQAYQKLLGNAG